MHIWTIATKAYKAHFDFVLIIAFAQLLLTVMTLSSGGLLKFVDLLAASYCYVVLAILFHHNALFGVRAAARFHWAKGRRGRLFLLRYFAISVAPFLPFFAIHHFRSSDWSAVEGMFLVACLVAYFVVGTLLSTMFPAIIANGDASFRKAVERGRASFGELVGGFMLGPVVFGLGVTVAIGLLAAAGAQTTPLNATGELSPAGLVFLYLQNICMSYATALSVAVVCDVYIDLEGQPDRSGTD